MADVITGLTCPNCSGSLSVREGQRIVKCPFCSARSLVRGDHGVTRYQVARRVDREAATRSVRGFWFGLNRAFDLSLRAQITETFLVYLPYWRALSQVAGWIFGQKKIRTNNSTTYEPREVRIMEVMDWTGAAGDVAEFGVERVKVDGSQLAAFDQDQLHAEGMVFEPTGSEQEAHDSARQSWDARARSRASLDRVSQVWLRFLREGMALVYYPLWVARYTYRNRVYQVVLDGSTGRVLYGKAPGNIYFRAFMLVVGAALGAFVAVDGLALAIVAVARSTDNESIALVVLPILAGIGIIAFGYRLFRWGEEIEVRAKIGR